MLCASRTTSLSTDQHFPTCRVWYAPQHSLAKVRQARAVAALRIGPNVKMHMQRTKPFEAYLRSKVAELQGCRPLVVFDFVDDGHSLPRVKADLLDVVPTGTEVKTVAVGASIGRHAHEPDKVLRELEDTLLVRKVESQALTAITGRAKPKLPYPEWTPDLLETVGR